MFVIRETITAKPGMASKLARMFREMLNEMPGTRSRILTDYVGPLNTVIWELEVGDLAEFDRMMQEYASRPELGKKMAGYNEMYLSGGREIFRVVD